MVLAGTHRQSPRCTSRSGSLETPGPAVTSTFTAPRDQAMPFQPNAGYPVHRPRRLRAHPRLRELIAREPFDHERPDLPSVRLSRHKPPPRDSVDARPVPALPRPVRRGRRPRSPNWVFPASCFSESRSTRMRSAPPPLATTGSSRKRSGSPGGRCPDLLVITDLCFCEYTDHGHCGPLSEIERPARCGQ